jgi:hypothetical protein
MNPALRTVVLIFALMFPGYGFAGPLGPIKAVGRWIDHHKLITIGAAAAGAGIGFAIAERGSGSKPCTAVGIIGCGSGFHLGGGLNASIPSAATLTMRHAQTDVIEQIQKHSGQVQ